MQHIERRQRRSPWASAALRLQLQEGTRRHRLQRMVLADAGGAIWAASHTDAESAALAAQLPGLATSGAAVRHGGTRVVPLDIATTRLYLAACGPDGADALLRIAPGVRRILCTLLDD